MKRFIRVQVLPICVLIVFFSDSFSLIARASSSTEKEFSASVITGMSNLEEDSGSALGLDTENELNDFQNGNNDLLFPYTLSISTGDNYSETAINSPDVDGQSLPDDIISESDSDPEQQTAGSFTTNNDEFGKKEAPMEESFMEAYADVREKLEDLYSENVNNVNFEKIAEYTSSLSAEQRVLADHYAEAAFEREMEPEQLSYIPGEVLIIYKDVYEAEIEEILNTSHATIDEELPLDFSEDYSVASVNISLEDTVGRAIEKLSHLDEIQYVQPNYLYRAFEDSDYDFYNADQYYLQLISALPAWEFLDTIEHHPVRTAIIDSGVDYTHDDLIHVVNRDLSVKIEENGHVSPLNGDSSGHGTAVAGILAAEASNHVGVAGVGAGFNDDIIDLVVIDASVTTDRYTTSSLIAAINYCLSCNVRVVNLSLGGYLSAGQDMLLSEKISEAATCGLLCVCAAGNDNADGGFYPASAEDAIAVIALDGTGFSRAPFSNYGSTNNKISSPGIDIYTTRNNNEWDYVSGSSFSTPQVTAAAAMVLSVNSDLSTYQVKDILFSTAEDLYEDGYDIESG